MTSIQNIPDRKRVEAYNQPPDAVKDAADRIGRAMRRRS
jgi:hypothetical protein